MHSACDSHHKLSDCSRILPNCHQTESQRRVELRDVSRIIGHDAPTIVPPPVVPAADHPAILDAIQIPSCAWRPRSPGSHSVSAARP